MVEMDFAKVSASFPLPPVGSIGAEAIRDDRKLHTRLVDDGAVGEMAGELPGQMVEAAPDVVDDVSDAEADVREDWLQVREGVDSVDVIAGLFVQLRPKGWTVGFNREYFADVGVKRVTMGFGPVEFCPATIEMNPVTHG